jgi:hypothetical protein
VNVYPFIEAEKQDSGNVTRACELLKVSRAAFYAHRAGPPGGTSRTLTWPRRSSPCIRSPRAVTAPRTSRPSCAAAVTGMAASGSPG